jgi:predicted nucleic acid-binding protein
VIGASALAYGLAVCTRNVSDFERFAGLDVVDRWA